MATLALVVKIARRPGVVTEDLRVLPGRVGLAAASISGMAAAVLVPYAPGLALGLVALSLGTHAVLALLLVRLLIAVPPGAREVNPGLHLAFVGFIVAAFVAAVLPLAEAAGLALLMAAVAVVVPTSWKVLAFWPGNRLAAKSYAVEA